MHLIGRQAGGGVMANEVSVKVAAVRQLPRADLVVATGQVFADEELLELLERRNNLLSHGLTPRGFETLLVGGRNALGKTLERFIKTALRGVGNNLLVNLGGDALHDHLGVHHAFLDSLAQQPDLLVHERGKRAQARQPVFIVLEGLKAQRAGQIVGGLYAVALVEVHQKPVKLVALHAVLVTLLEEVVVKLVGGRQSGAVNLAKAREHFLVVLIAPGKSFQAVIRPAVVPAAVAQRGCELRRLLHVIFPLRRKQIVQRLRRRGGPLC